MRLFVDLDSRDFIESLQFPRVVQSLALKRRDHIALDVQFLRGGVIMELAPAAQGRLGLKADKDFNGPFVAADLQWVKSGAGASTSYRFDLNLNTVQIDALFAGVPTPAAVILMLEIEWIEDDLRTSSSTLPVSLENDVVRGDEGVAQDADPPYPLPEEIGVRGSTTPDLRLDITNLTGGNPEALDSIPTASLAVPYLVAAVLDNALRFYLLTSGNVAEAAPGLIRPDDFAASENEKIWRQIL